MASRSVRSWLPMILALGVGMPVGNIAVRELRPDMDKWPAIFLGSLIGGVGGVRDRGLALGRASRLAAGSKAPRTG
jgi:hypothetical protein